MEGKIKTEPTAIAVIVLFGIHAFRGAIDSDVVAVAVAGMIIVAVMVIAACFFLSK